jgi:Protein kinase domain
MLALTARGCAIYNSNNAHLDGGIVYMSIDIDDVLTRLALGIMEEKEACKSFELLARENVELAQSAIRRVESALSGGRLSPAVARSLLDALQSGSATDKTVWIDQKSMVSTQPVKVAPSAQPPAQPIAKPVARTATRSSSFITGTVIKGRYRLLEALGHSRTALTFDAIDMQAPSNTAASITIKLIIANFDAHPAAYTQLEEAVHATRDLHHLHIAVPVAVEREGDVAILVYEPLAGRWLSTIVRELRDQGMELSAALAYWRSLAEALAYAHRHGIAHGEFNPRNILLTGDGTPKILNFGIAPALAQAVESEDPDALDTLTMRAYTEAYSVDGEIGAEPTPAADTYALALMAFELITGRHPFRRQSLKIARGLAMTVPSIEGLTARQNTTLARAVSYDPRQRLRTASALLKRWDGPSVLKRMSWAIAGALLIAAIWFFAHA